jgi:hypothetical protein
MSYNQKFLEYKQCDPPYSVSLVATDKDKERKDLYFPDGSKATESELKIFWRERLYLRNS